MVFTERAVIAVTDSYRFEICILKNLLLIISIIGTGEYNRTFGNCLFGFICSWKLLFVAIRKLSFTDEQLRVNVNTLLTLG